MELPNIMTDNIRQTFIAKTRRNRQCFKCRCKINKGNDYVNHQFKYDNRILTISLHLDCCDDLVINKRQF